MIIIETCPECGEPLMDEILCTFPPIPKKYCFKCGYSWTGSPEPIVYKQFNINNNINSYEE